MLHDDTLLVGGYNDGIVRWVPSTGEQRHALVERTLQPNEERMRSNSINGFVRDRTGRVLASTTGQPLEVHAATMQLVELPQLLGNLPEGRPARFTTFLVPEGEHYLWAGTWARGLFRIDLRDGSVAHTDERGGRSAA